MKRSGWQRWPWLSVACPLLVALPGWVVPLEQAQAQVAASPGYSITSPEIGWADYIGGSSVDYGRGIVVDREGNVLVTGSTASSDWIASFSTDDILDLLTFAKQMDQPTNCASQVLRREFSASLLALFASKDWTFSGQDIRDQTWLVNRICQATDCVSQMLTNRFSTSLATICAGTPEVQLATLVQQLNLVIAGPLIYDAHCFEKVMLSPETENLLDQNRKKAFTGDDLVYLNRVLLEDAYPPGLKKIKEALVNELNLTINGPRLLIIRTNLVIHEDNFVAGWACALQPYTGVELPKDTLQQLGFLTFETDNITSLPSLVAALLEPTNRVSQYLLMNEFSSSTVRSLTNYTGALYDPELEKTLVNELNDTIKGASIYESNRFAYVNLAPSTVALNDLLGPNPPSGNDRTLLNRLLLEDTYPELRWLEPPGQDLNLLNRLLWEAAYPEELAMSEDKYNGGNSNEGTEDAFVAKYSPTGAFLWSTYLGGTKDDSGNGIVVDSRNNILVVGSTRSSKWISGGYDTRLDTDYNANQDVFVAKLNPDGVPLWSTYLGDSGIESGGGIAVDGADNVLVTGSTYSSYWVYGGYSTNRSGTKDAVVAKLSPEGSLLWSSYLGGIYRDQGNAVAADANGNVYVAGTTESGDWITKGVGTNYQGNNSAVGGRTTDAFVMVLSADGKTNLWGTYLGGYYNEEGNGIALDEAGNVLVTGSTTSSNWVRGGFDTRFNGSTDAFVAKLNPTGNLLWSTYLGGIGTDIGLGIAVNRESDILVTGTTGSRVWISGGFDTSLGGPSDAFVTKLGPFGTVLGSAYIGGEGTESGGGLTTDLQGDILVTGQTFSGGWLTNGFRTNYHGNGDAFVAKLQNFEYWRRLAAPRLSYPCGITVSTNSPALWWQDVDHESGYVVEIFYGESCDAAQAPLVYRTWLPPDTFTTPVPDAAGLSACKFLFGDITNVPMFAVQMCAATDCVSQFLTNHFSPLLMRMLCESSGSGSNAVLEATLVNELNLVIEGPSIYDEQCFHGVDLSSDTRKLLDQNAQDPLEGQALICLNRLLLQDAYPDQIAPYEATYWWQVQAAGDGVAWHDSSWSGCCAFTLEDDKPDSKLPSVSVKSPKANARLTNAVVLVQGTAKDNLGVAQVRCQINGGNWFVADGTVNWFADIDLGLGNNVFQVYAVDGTGNYSKTNKVTYVLLSPITLLTNGQGTISRSFKGDMLEIGKSYKVTAAPKSGYLFQRWTGSLISTNAALKFVMQSNMVLRAEFVSSTPGLAVGRMTMGAIPFFGLGGVYSGLFYPGGSGEGTEGGPSPLAPTTPVNSGSLVLNLTAEGTASGQLMLAGQTYSFSDLSFDSEGLARARLERLSPAPPLELHLRLDLNRRAGVLQGTVSGGNWESGLLAFRNWPLANWAGNYTFVLSGGAVDDTSTPAGYGAGTLVVTRSGRTQLVGSLADGTEISAEGGLSQHGWWPLYVPLQVGQGMVLGWVQFATNAGWLNVLSTNLWVKSPLADSIDPYYGEGFAVTRELWGVRYQAPQSGQNLWGWTNGVIELAGGNLATPLTHAVTWAEDTLHVSANDNQVSVQFAPSNGLFHGSFVHPATGKPVTFHGALLQGAGWGVGWFLGTNQSGHLLIQQTGP